ncbi:MAG: thioesterase family protein [Desulfobacterales bacterium]
MTLLIAAPFQHPFRVRYAETDAQGIVFYGNYLIYFDTAIYEYLRNLEFDLKTHVAHSGADFHVVHAAVDYNAPARFEDDLRVNISVGRIGRSSLTFQGHVYLAANDTLLAAGKIVWAYVHQQSQQSMALPPELVQRIEAYENPKS